MKFPGSVDCSKALSTAQYDDIIDVRSPAEYKHDHIPGAINLPVLSDQERIVVGTLYKQTGSFEAKRLGAALVAKNIASHLEAELAQRSRAWRPLIYCWRGGNRSASMAHILAKIGWPVDVMIGGYKSYRHYVIDSLNTLPQQFNWISLSGPTGSAKTRLLDQLKLAGEQVLNLEELAQHRGSLLGNLSNQEQPSQKYFESLLATHLRGYAPDKPLFVESESVKIGNLRVPPEIVCAIRQARQVKLNLAIQSRIKLLREEYSHWLSEEQKLLNRLEHFQTLVGKLKVQEWKNLLMQAKYDELVHAMLLQHYDPAYLKASRYQETSSAPTLAIHLTGYSEAELKLAARSLIDQLSLSSMI